MFKIYNFAHLLLIIFSISFSGNRTFSQDYKLKNLHILQGTEDNVIVTQHMGKDARGNVFGFSTAKGNFIAGNDTFLSSNINSNIIITRFKENGEINNNIFVDYSDFDKATDVAINAGNEIYISGYFNSPIADSATILLKCNAKGKILWKLKVSCAKCIGQGVCVDDEGNCYVTGYIVDSLCIGEYRFVSNPNISYGSFIIKLNPEGEILWVRTPAAHKDKIEAQHYNFARMTPHLHAIRPDNKGNLYFVGHFSGHVNLGSFNAYTTKNLNVKQTGYNETYYLGKLNKNGEILWLTNEQVPDKSYADKLEIDKYDNVYINTASFIIKYNMDGKLISKLRTKAVHTQNAITDKGQIMLINEGIFDSNNDTILSFNNNFPIKNANRIISDNSNLFYFKTGTSYSIYHFPILDTFSNIKQVIPHASLSSDFIFFPNPANDFVNFELINVHNSIILIKITDLSGRIINSFSYKSTSLNYETNIKLCHLNSGVYFISVLAGEKLYTRKLVKL